MNATITPKPSIYHTIQTHQVIPAQTPVIVLSIPHHHPIIKSVSRQVRQADILPFLQSHHHPIPSHIYFLDSLPTSIVDVHLQLPTNHTGHAMAQPNGPQKRIISLLVQEELPTVPQSRIYLTVFINIRCDHPRARGVVEVEYCALADVDKETDVLLAPGEKVLAREHW
jgi:hypothetical protein